MANQQKNKFEVAFFDDQFYQRIVHFVFISSLFFQYVNVTQGGFSFGRMLLLTFIALQLILNLGLNKKQITNFFIITFALPVFIILLPSIIISPDHIGSLRQLLLMFSSIIALILFWGSLGNFKLWDNIHFIANCFSFFAILVSIDILVNYDSSSESLIAQVKGIRGVGSFFDDPNYLGVYLAFIFSFLLPVSILTSKTINKIIYLTAIIFLIGSIIITVSRAGLLAIVIVTLFSAGYFLFYNFKKIVPLIIIFFIGVVLVFTFTDIPEKILTANKKLERINDAIEGKDASIGQRIKILRVGLIMLESNLLFGVGFDQFENMFNQYREYSILTGSGRAAHNTFLRFAAEIGLIPFLFIILLIVYHYLIAFNSLNKIKNNVWIIVCFSTLVAITIGALTLDFKSEFHLWFSILMLPMLAHLELKSYSA